MAFKPGRKVAGVPDLDRLRTTLNQTNTSSGNNPLYQFLNELLNNVDGIQSYLTGLINNSSGNITPSPTPGPSSGKDYVVLSDGGLPTPQPIDDGFGNFIYIQYTP